VRDQARAVAQRTDQAAAALDSVPEVAGDRDGTQTEVDGASPVTLPLESTSAVSGLSDELLRFLQAAGLVGDPPLAVPGYQLGPPGAGTGPP